MEIRCTTRNLESISKSNLCRLRSGSIYNYFGRSAGGAMKKAETTEAGVCLGLRCSWPLVSVVVFSLVSSLATRTSCLTTTHGVVVHSGAAQGMRQHLDRDAIHWVPPVPVSTDLQATFSPHVAPARPLLGILLLDENLYNRPPPSWAS